MNSEAQQFLFKLLNTPSPTGFESEGQKVWMNYVGQFADSLDNDSYGNAWATLAGDELSARIMLEAHADEIGFMIQNITDDGFVYVTRIGGSDRAIARGKRVQILGERGPVLGVIGNIAIHLRDKERDFARASDGRQAHADEMPDRAVPTPDRVSGASGRDHDAAWYEDAFAL